MSGRGRGRGRGRGIFYLNLLRKQLEKRQESNSNTASNENVSNNETISQFRDSSKEVLVASNEPITGSSNNKKLSDINQIAKDIVSSGIMVMQENNIKNNKKGHLLERETTMSQCSDSSSSTDSENERYNRLNQILINARKQARLETLASETQNQNVSTTHDEPKPEPSKEATQPMKIVTATEQHYQPLENAPEPMETTQIANIYHSENENTASSFPAWGTFVSPSSQLNVVEQWHLSGTLETGKYVKVTVNFVMDTFAYVMDVRDSELFLNMKRCINADNTTIPLSHVMNGGLCYLEFDKTMHRGVITHTNESFTDIQIIDFGPETRIENSNISKELFQIHNINVKSYRPFATRVKPVLTSDFTFKIGNTYDVKVISQIDHCYMVQVMGFEPVGHPELNNPIKCPLDYLTLNSKGMMKIEHRFSYNKATASLETSVANKIASDLRAAPNKSAIEGFYSFGKNTIVMCKSPNIEHEWARGKVFTLWGHRNVVALFDTGAIEESCEFYVHPPIHEITPPQSFIVRVTLVMSDAYESYMKPGKWLVYIVKKVYPNIEILCMTSNKQNLFRAEVTPWALNVDQCRLVNTPAPVYFRVSRIFKVDNAYTIFIISQKRDVIGRYYAIVDAVEKYAQSNKARSLNAMPMRNDMVLCYCNDLGKYHRAIVKRAENIFNIQVLYTELGIEEVVSFNEIRDLPDTLKQDPMYLLKVQLLNVPKKEDDAAVACLVNCNQMFTVKFNMDYYPDVELLYLNDETSLNEKITKIVSETRCFLEDTFLALPCGNYVEICIIDNSQIRYGSIYATTNDLKKSNLCHKVFVDLHAELVSTYEFVDTTPYRPVTREIVAGRFPGESWRRAVCIKVGYGAYEDKFLLRNLDGGGIKWILLKYIRKMNKKFLKLPYLACNVSFDWLYHPVSPEQAKSLAERFMPGMVKKCNLRKIGPGDYKMSKYWR